MSQYEIGDLVVLTAGSMRMAVEAVDGMQVATVWCHEGEIGRDTFHVRLLKKWEVRDEDRPARAPGGSKPYPPRDREGGGKPYAPREERGARDDRPRDSKPGGKPGWDGKPREKKFFRKD